MLLILPLLPPNAGFPRVVSEREAGDGMRRGGECRPAASSSSPHASALGGGSIPPPLSRLGVGFWYKFVPPSNGRFGRGAHPPSPPKTIKIAAHPSHRPKKISPKNFWKGDNICHISCAIMRVWISYRTISTRRSSRARRLALISITTPATPPIDPTFTWAAKRMPSSK